eukprot:scaffold44682_cov69-Phaeocystis_antarctica.AAC.3
MLTLFWSFDPGTTDRRRPRAPGAGCGLPVRGAASAECGTWHMGHGGTGHCALRATHTPDPCLPHCSRVIARKNMYTKP